MALAASHRSKSLQISFVLKQVNNSNSKVSWFYFLPMQFVPEQVNVSGNKADRSVLLSKIMSLSSWKISTQAALDKKQLRLSHLTDGLLTSKKEKSTVRLITRPTCWDRTQAHTHCKAFCRDYQVFARTYDSHRYLFKEILDTLIRSHTYLSGLISWTWETFVI